MLISHKRGSRPVAWVSTALLILAFSTVTTPARAKPRPILSPTPSAVPLTVADPTHPPGAADPQEAGAMTLQSSVGLALERNPRMKIAQERVAAARAQYEETATFKNPRLVFSDTTTILPQGGNSIDTSPLVGKLLPSNFPRQFILTDTVQSQINLSLQVLLTTFGRVEKQTAASFMNIDAQAKASDVDRRALSHDIKQAFIVHLKALAESEAARANLEVSQQNLHDSEALFRQGILAKFDVVQADLQVVEATQKLEQRRTNIETSAAALRSLLVMPRGSALRLVPPLSIQVDPGVEIVGLQATALSHRPELISLDRQMTVAQTLLEAAHNESNPQVGLSLSYLTNPGNTLAPSDRVVVGLNFSWPLFDGGLRQAKVSQAESQIRAIQAQGEQVRTVILLEVEKAWLNYQQTYYDLQTAEKRVEAAMVYYDMARQRYINGLGTSLETQDALRSLNDARLGLVVASYTRDLAFTDLEQSLGMDFFDRHLTIAKEAGKE